MSGTTIGSSEYLLATADVKALDLDKRYANQQFGRLFQLFCKEKGLSDARNPSRSDRDNFKLALLLLVEKIGDHFSFAQLADLTAYSENADAPISSEVAESREKFFKIISPCFEVLELGSASDTLRFEPEKMIGPVSRHLKSSPRVYSLRSPKSVYEKLMAGQDYRSSWLYDSDLQRLAGSSVGVSVIDEAGINFAEMLKQRFNDWDASGRAEPKTFHFLLNKTASVSDSGAHWVWAKARFAEWPDGTVHLETTLTDSFSSSISSDLLTRHVSSAVRDLSDTNQGLRVEHHEEVVSLQDQADGWSCGYLALYHLFSDPTCPAELQTSPLYAAFEAIRTAHTNPSTPAEKRALSLAVEGAVLAQLTMGVEVAPVPEVPVVEVKLAPKKRSFFDRLLGRNKKEPEPEPAPAPSAEDKSKESVELSGLITKFMRLCPGQDLPFDHEEIATDLRTEATGNPQTNLLAYLGKGHANLPVDKKRLKRRISEAEAARSDQERFSKALTASDETGVVSVRLADLCHFSPVQSDPSVQDKILRSRCAVLQSKLLTESGLSSLEIKLDSKDQLSKQEEQILALLKQLVSIRVVFIHDGDAVKLDSGSVIETEASFMTTQVEWVVSSNFPLDRLNSHQPLMYQLLCFALSGSYQLKGEQSSGWQDALDWGVFPKEVSTRLLEAYQEALLNGLPLPSLPETVRFDLALKAGTDTAPDYLSKMNALNLPDGILLPFRTIQIKTNEGALSDSQIEALISFYKKCVDGVQLEIFGVDSPELRAKFDEDGLSVVFKNSDGDIVANNQPLLKARNDHAEAVLEAEYPESEEDVPDAEVLADSDRAPRLYKLGGVDLNLEINTDADADADADADSDAACEDIDLSGMSENGVYRDLPSHLTLLPMAELTRRKGGFPLSSVWLLPKAIHFVTPEALRLLERYSPQLQGGLTPTDLPLGFVMYEMPDGVGRALHYMSPTQEEIDECNSAPFRRQLRDDLPKLCSDKSAEHSEALEAFRDKFYPGVTSVGKAQKDIEEALMGLLQNYGESSLKLAVKRLMNFSDVSELEVFCCNVANTRNLSELLKPGYEHRVLTPYLSLPAAARSWLCAYGQKFIKESSGNSDWSFTAEDRVTAMVAFVDKWPLDLPAVSALPVNMDLRVVLRRLLQMYKNTAPAFRKLQFSEETLASLSLDAHAAPYALEEGGFSVVVSGAGLGENCVVQQQMQMQSGSSAVEDGLQYRVQRADLEAAFEQEPDLTADSAQVDSPEYCQSFLKLALSNSELELDQEGFNATVSMLSILSTSERSTYLNSQQKTHQKPESLARQKLLNIAMSCVRYLCQMKQQITADQLMYLIAGIDSLKEHKGASGAFKQFALPLMTMAAAASLRAGENLDGLWDQIQAEIIAQSFDKESGLCDEKALKQLCELGFVKASCAIRLSDIPRLLDYLKANPSEGEDLKDQPALQSGLLAMLRELPDEKKEDFDKFEKNLPIIFEMMSEFKASSITTDSFARLLIKAKLAKFDGLVSAINEIPVPQARSLLVQVLVGCDFSERNHDRILKSVKNAKDWCDSNPLEIVTLKHMRTCVKDGFDGEEASSRPTASVTDNSKELEQMSKRQLKALEEFLAMLKNQAGIPDSVKTLIAEQEKKTGSERINGFLTGLSDIKLPLGVATIVEMLLKQKMESRLHTFQIIYRLNMPFFATYIEGNAQNPILEVLSAVFPQLRFKNFDGLAKELTPKGLSDIPRVYADMSKIDLEHGPLVKVLSQFQTLLDGASSSFSQVFDKNKAKVKLLQEAGQLLPLLSQLLELDKALCTVDLINAFLAQGTENIAPRIEVLSAFSRLPTVIQKQNMLDALADERCEATAGLIQALLAEEYPHQHPLFSLLEQETLPDSDTIEFCLDNIPDLTILSAPAAEGDRNQERCIALRNQVFSGGNQSLLHKLMLLQAWLTEQAIPDEHRRLLFALFKDALLDKSCSAETQFKDLLQKLPKEPNLYLPVVDGFSDSDTISSAELLVGLSGEGREGLVRAQAKMDERVILDQNTIGNAKECLSLMMDMQQEVDFPDGLAQDRVAQFHYINAVGFTKPPMHSGFSKAFIDCTDVELKKCYQHYRSELSKMDPSYSDYQIMVLEMIALVREVVYRKTNKFLYPVQLLTVLNSIFLPGNVLNQMNTGEGKTITTAVTAAVLAGLDSEASVDVSSSDASLAADGLKEMSPIFRALGLSSQKLTVSSPVQDYQGGQIHYASDEALAMLIQRAITTGQPLPERAHRLVDEADQTMLSNTSLYRLVTTGGQATHPQADLFPFILDFVNRDEHWNKRCSPEQDVLDLKFYLRTLDRTGETRNGIHYQTSKKSDNVLLEEVKVLLAGVSDDDLSRWIDAASTALRMEKGKHYNSRNCHNAGVWTREAVVINQVTKQESPSSRFSDSVHQLLHVRLNAEEKGNGAFPVLPEARTVSAWSARDMHTYYSPRGKTIAVTGTVGGSAEVTEFADTYGFTSVQVPPNNSSKRVDHPPEVARVKTDLFGRPKETKKEANFRAVLEKIEAVGGSTDGRPILVFFENPAELGEFKAYCKRKNIEKVDSDSWQFYDAVGKAEGEEGPTRDDIINNAGEFGHVTFSTAALGRGTDFSTEHGDGFVAIRTYLTTDRESRQEAGRVARNGNPGESHTCLSEEAVMTDSIVPSGLELLTVISNKQAALERQSACRRFVNQACSDFMRQVSEQYFGEFKHTSSAVLDQHAGAGFSKSRRLKSFILAQNNRWDAFQKKQKDLWKSSTLALQKTRPGSDDEMTAFRDELRGIQEEFSKQLKTNFESFVAEEAEHLKVQFDKLGIRMTPEQHEAVKAAGSVELKTIDRAEYGGSSARDDVLFYEVDSPEEAYETVSGITLSENDSSEIKSRLLKEYRQKMADLGLGIVVEEPDSLTQLHQQLSTYLKENPGSKKSSQVLQLATVVERSCRRLRVDLDNSSNPQDTSEDVARKESQDIQKELEDYMHTGWPRPAAVRLRSAESLLRLLQNVHGTNVDRLQSFMRQLKIEKTSLLQNATDRYSPSVTAAGRSGRLLDLLERIESRQAVKFAPYVKEKPVQNLLQNEANPLETACSTELLHSVNESLLKFGVQKVQRVGSVSNMRKRLENTVAQLETKIEAMQQKNWFTRRVLPIKQAKRVQGQVRAMIASLDNLKTCELLKKGVAIDATAGSSLSRKGVKVTLPCVGEEEDAWFVHYSHADGVIGLSKGKSQELESDQLCHQYLEELFKHPRSQFVVEMNKHGTLIKRLVSSLEDDMKKACQEKFAEIEKPTPVQAWMRDVLSLQTSGTSTDKIGSPPRVAAPFAYALGQVPIPEGSVAAASA